VQRGAATALDSVHIPHCEYAGDIALTSNTAESLQLQQNKFYDYTRLEKKRKDSAGSADTVSMIKGGGYIGACTRQPPTAQTIKKKLMWVREVVCC